MARLLRQLMFMKSRHCCLPVDCSYQTYISPLRAQLVTERYYNIRGPSGYDVGGGVQQQVRTYATNTSKPGKRPGSKDKSRIGPVTWTSLAVSTCVVGIAIYFIRRETDRKEKEMNRIESIGKMDIGGPWEGLVDNKGVVRASSDFLGHWVYLYFGFTHCPDICPDELEKIVSAVDMIEESPRVDNVQPIFFTIDPHRDTPERVDAYIKDFSPKLIGLTGEPTKVSQVARLFRIYQSEGPRDEDDDYIVDHSIITYLINPDGECVSFFTKSQNARVMANDTMLQMMQYNRAKEQQLQQRTQPQPAQ